MKRHLLPSLACLWFSGAGVFAETPSAAGLPAPASDSASVSTAAAEPANEKNSPAASKPDAEEERTNYVRMAADSTSTRMETAIGGFTLPDGRAVDLVGVVHLGDKSYYADLNERLGTYDAVLFELVGDPEALQSRKPTDVEDDDRPTHPLRMIQQAMGRMLRLEFQLENIDYSRPNFVHADASGEEFEAMQKERGESMMKLLAKSMELSSDPEMSAKFREAQDISLADLIMIFYSDKAAARFKVVFGNLLSESEQILDKKLLGKDSAIITGRNGVALKKLEQVLADPAKKRVCIFYGAGHMPSMESALIEKFHAKPASFNWLTAWNMPPPEKKTKSTPEGKKAGEEKPVPDEKPAAAEPSK